MTRTAPALLVVLATACDPGQPAVPPPVAPAMPAPLRDSRNEDPLGPKPVTAPAPPYAPPTPEVFDGPNGIRVWLLERHTLPYVAIAAAVPTGSAADPPGKGGLADVTANMLDEGAGARGAIELSSAVETLGATLTTGASSDDSDVSLTVLKKNLAPAFALFGDVVARPRFDAKEWKRVHDLWQNDLKERSSDPRGVSRVVARAAMFGPDHPYGHPVDGTLASAQNVTLDDVRSFYPSAWRPDRLVIVAVGDVTKAELGPMLASAFSGWKAPATQAPAPVAPPAPKGPWPKVVLVDRPDAPQSVVNLVRPGVAAADPVAAPLWRVNEAIGGSYTSRLNQHLREEKGWTYGAYSHVVVARGTGQIIAGAAVFSDKTLDAAKLLLGDLSTFSSRGLAPEEVERSRSQARADLVEAYGGVAGAAWRLVTDAALSLPPDYEASAALRRDAATKGALDKLAADYFDPSRGVLVIVGPRAKIEGGLAALGLSPVELRDPEGNVVKP